MGLEVGGGDKKGGRKFTCVKAKVIDPFGAAALLSHNLNHTLFKQGTGTADHLPPLGCYFFSFSMQS